jgi:hypothetical protein
MLLSMLALPLDAHEGEDHGAPPPTVIQDASPRAYASSEALEVVAVLEARQLVLYVDRHGSNEPVADARVEVEGAGLNGIAAQTSPGTYVMAVSKPVAPARHALTIALEAGDSADLLAATLDISQQKMGIEPVPYRSKWALRGISALALLAVAAFTVMRLRRNKNSGKREVRK